MPYEITTPRLIKAADAAETVIDGLFRDTLDPRLAREINAANGRLISAVREDVRARTAHSRIRSDEARLIEDRSRRLDRASAPAAAPDPAAVAPATPTG